MIRINELRINKEATKLIIDMEIENKSYLENIKFDNIQIVTEQYFNPDQAGSYIAYKISNIDGKRVTAEIDCNDLLYGDYKKNMFFIWIKTKGILGDCAPCSDSSDNAVLAVYWKKGIMDMYVHYLKDMTACCDLPQDFVDFLLRAKALDLSIKTGHYIEAIKFFRYLTSKMTKHIVKHCNCGR